MGTYANMAVQCCASPCEGKTRTQQHFARVQSSDGVVMSNSTFIVALLLNPCFEIAASQIQPL